jgi:ABC-2 type transport system permease protein
MTIVVTAGSAIILGVHPNLIYLILITIPSLLVFASLGALLCVLVKEVFEAQTLLNLPRFLMIFLCGVVYPISAMPTGLRYFAHFMPLTYTVDGLRHSFTNSSITPVIIDTLFLTGFLVLFLFPALSLLQKRFE